MDDLGKKFNGIHTGTRSVYITFRAFSRRFFPKRLLYLCQYSKDVHRTM